MSLTHEFGLDDLADATTRDKLKWAMSDPERLRPGESRQALTERAAATFAVLAQSLRERGHDPQAVAHFVNRLVFCMFAEDVGLLPADMFTRMLKQARTQPEEFSTMARTLFGAMATGGLVGFETVAWFNGGLFDDDAALPLEKSEIETTLEAAALDWSEIDPSILGTLFERGLDPDKRSQLGAHYTDRDKIMRIVEPVVVRPWLAEWEAAKSEITGRLDRAAAAKSQSAKTQHRGQAERRLRAFLERLPEFTVLDPACGSGNFLYLALHALKDLEHRVQLEAEAMGLQRAFPAVGPANVRGIEINAYAADLARVSVWIGEIQWMRRNGFRESRDPILKPLETIECRDAILTPEGGEPEWPPADVVIGNPPFLGGKLLNTHLGEDYVSRIFKVYAGRVPAEADLVCYWFVKAGEHVEALRAKRVGLVSTNSIRGGANRRALQTAIEGLPIFEAWSDEPWVIDGAAVRVSLVCFARPEDGSTPAPERRLDGEVVDAVHADLTARRGGAGVDLTGVQRLYRNLGVTFMGDTKGGPFDVPGEQAREWLREPANPNGRPNSDVLGPWMNGMDVTRRPSDKWIVDFGWDMVREEAALYEAPFQRPGAARRNSSPQLDRLHSAGLPADGEPPDDSADRTARALRSTVRPIAAGSMRASGSSSRGLGRTVLARSSVGLPRGPAASASEERMSSWSRLRADFVPAKLVRAVAVGWLMGAVIVIHCIALSAIVFSGPMLPFAVQGAGMMLFGGMVFCLAVGVTSSYPGMLAVPQEVPATVLGTLGAAVVGGTVGASGDAAFMTMAALLVLSSLLTGLLFLAIGHFRLSHLFRFIPYPVAGGFFAGTGWVLSLAALSVMCGVVLDWQTLPRIFDPAIVWKWGPGAAYGLVLAVVMKRKGNLAIMMGSVVLVSALYHLGLIVLDISVEDAKAQGLLMSGIPEGGLWPAFGLSDLESIEWRVVAGQVPTIFAVTLVTLLCLLVYVNGLEVATGVDIDLDQEFRVAGFAGMCAGAGGSAPGCHAFVFTLPCRMLGADTPWTGIVVALVLALSLFFGSGLLELLPMSIIGGLLLFIGVDLLDNWLVKVRKRLHWTDYGMIVLICGTVAVFGFIEGVGVGMLATLAQFAIRLSRVDVIEEEFKGHERQSTKLRSVPDRTILVDRGGLLRAYRLRGYIFFGSVHPLVDHLKKPLDEDPPPACIVLDFESVSGCDLSAANTLCQFVRSADSAGAKVALSAVPSQLKDSLEINLPAELRDRLWFEPDLDHGLERCEDAIVAMVGKDLSGPAAQRFRSSLLERVAADLERHLDEQVRFEEMLEQLDPWLEPREYEVGELLAVRGEVQDGLQLVVSGQASVHDADGARLYQCGPGDVIEPWSAFSEHTASTTIIARDRCRTMMLTSSARALLESDDGELTLRFFAFLISRKPPGALTLNTD